MITGNKGEWSEFYAFLKLLAERKIFGADADLNKIETKFFPILKIIREEKDGKSEYELLSGETISIQHTNGDISIVNGSDLKTKVIEIFNAIKSATETFEIPLAEELIERFGVHTLNAGNGRKEDLILKVHDLTIGEDLDMGFSVKSKLGSAATLLNASGATNFIYKITGLDNDKVDDINGIFTKAKVRDRIIQIIDEGASLDFYRLESSVFEKNLRKIDTVMPEILAEMLLAYYSDKGADFWGLSNLLAREGIKIRNFEFSSEDFEYKIKALLCNVALGMVPAHAWDGTLRAHGGVIFVREDGEVVCYHLYDAEAFRDYLFAHTIFDTASTTRHKHGTIYYENGEKFIKLNLQIRFNR